MKWRSANIDQYCWFEAKKVGLCLKLDYKCPGGGVTPYIVYGTDVPLE